MRQSKRGPERRRSAKSEAATTDDNENRRELEDRRRNRYVSDLDLCRGLPYDDVEAILEHCPQKILKAGEILLEPGDANHYLFFLVRGHLEIRLQSLSAPVTDVIEVGECIGEMSIIDGQPTSAYVIATTESTLIAVHENIFWSKLGTNSQTVRNLSRVLAERMRKRNAASLIALEQQIRLDQLQKELDAAYEIQLGMLPPGPELLEASANVEAYARMDVAKVVGGDFYDAFTRGDRYVCIAVGDISGKGMPAALFMIRAMTLLRAELAKPIDLASRMSRFNRALCETNISHMFASLVVLEIDTESGAATYVNAGHLPLLHARGDTAFVEVDESRGLIAGVLDDTNYTLGYLQLEPDDRLLLFTDGVTESRDPGHEFYTLSGLVDFLHERSSSDTGGMVNAIFDDLASFAGGAAQADDITVVGLRYRGDANSRA